MSSYKSQTGNLERELQMVRGQHADSLTQVQKLTASLQRLQASSKDTRDALSAEVWWSLIGVFVCVCVCVRACVCACVYLYVHVHGCMHIDAYVCVSAHFCVHV